METIIENLIKQKMFDFMTGIINKYPIIDKSTVNHKINSIFNKNKGLNLPKIKVGLILPKIEENKDVIKVVKSPFSNYILKAHFDDITLNKLVMNLTTKNIIGFENENGEVEPLNKNLIEICNKYKIKYKIPLNLNLNNDGEIDEVIVNELEELGLNYAESEEENDE